MHIWQIRLFGSLRVSRGGEDVSRFSTRKTGALLAFLAFHPDQRHSRDALCDLLWPDAPPLTSRARLRVALTSLRHQLEPPGVPPGSVLLSHGHDQIQLSAAAVATDVAEVEQALRVLGDPAGSRMPERLAAGERLVALFTEPLLTGFYEDWVITERERLNALAVERLSALAREAPAEKALIFARHASRLDPLSEEPLFPLLTRMAESGQLPAARRLFHSYSRRVQAELGAEPSAALRSLADALPDGWESGTALSPHAKAVAPPGPVPLRVAELAPSRRLPPYHTRFFGRDGEVRELGEALQDSVMLTVTGPGGMGKTRLAVEAGRTWDGASFFVPLAEVSEPSGIPAAIYDALGGEKSKRIKDGPDALLARAAELLAGEPRPLLILDNLEQIADSAGSVLLSLLGRVPALRLLATSRLRLHLPGEREYPLGPLPVPPSDGGSPLSATAEFASIALFSDRARAARPDFQITERNREDVTAICHLLEGSPLAIELVAARAASLVPAQMRRQLSEQGSLTITARRAGPGDRHGSLYAAIDWSYRLLSPDLRDLFTRLSVFRGSFTGEAAAAVCEIPDENLAGERIARLRAHSLVGSAPDAAEMRYSLLESLRVFGDAKLDDGERLFIHDRHAAWFAERAERIEAELDGQEQVIWLEQIDADLPNYRAAMARDLTARPPRALQLAGALASYWNLRGMPTEGRAWLEKALSAQDALTADGHGHRSRALNGAGTLAMMQGDNASAQKFFEESLALRRRPGGDPTALASTLNSLGLLHLSRQEWPQARLYFGESLVLRRASGAAENLAAPLLNMGVVEWETGDYLAAKPFYEEALALYRKRGDRVGEAQALNNLGTVALCVGDFTGAEQRYGESLALKRIVGNPLGIANTLSNVGVAAMYQGRHATATAHFEEALALFRQIDVPEAIAAELRNLGQTATYRQEWELAYSLLAESLTRVRESDTPDDLYGNLEGFAIFAGARGEHAAAARLLGAADAVRTRADSPVYPPERAALDETADAARASLGDESFARHYQEGAALSDAEAASEALALAP